MRNEGGSGTPASASMRHFVFAPGGLARREHVGRYFFSLAAFIIFAGVFQFSAGLVLGYLSINNPDLRVALNALANGLLGAPWDMFFLLAAFSFGTYILAMAASLAVVHRRSLLTVLTDGRRFDWWRMGRAFLLYAALLTAPFFLYLVTTKTPPVLHFEPWSFAKLLFISAGALIIQTSAEEIVFRGYLTQFMASFTNSVFVIVGMPSLLFALAHIGNPELVADPGVFTFYLGFGVFMSLTAIRDRSVELTVGAHFANNLVLAVLVRPHDSVFQTPTLFLLPEQPSIDVPIFGPTLAPLLFFILTALFMRRRELA